MATKLLFLDDSELYEHDAQIQTVTNLDPGRVELVFDETVFYPQGGGQPTDHGHVTTDSGSVDVDKVSFDNGTVRHQGSIEGNIVAGSMAHQRIDAERRRMHARLHTAGHLVMAAVDRVAKMPALKGYHFPDGPYVEFEGTIPEEERPAFLSKVQAEIDEMVADDSEVASRFDSVDNLRASGVYMPAEIPAGKPTRVVITCDYISPCGGTHVKRLGELEGMHVKGIKNKSGRTRVSYSI